MPAPHHSVFIGRMPFLPPNQQRQSTEITPKTKAGETKSSNISTTSSFLVSSVTASESSACLTEYLVLSC